MARNSDDTLFDKRLIERHLRKGTITREQLDKHLQGIQDAAGQADVLRFDELASRRSTAASGNSGDEPAA